MLQIILLLVVAGIAAYFIAASRKSKVEEVSKETSVPKNPTFDPVVHAPLPVEEVFVDANPIASVQQIEELKEAKKVVKKAAPKKKTTK